MFLNILSLFTFLKYTNLIICSNTQYQTIDKEKINGLSITAGNKLVIKNKIDPVLSKDIKKGKIYSKYFLIPLFTNGEYKNKDLEHSLMMKYEQKYFIPKNTVITHNSEKFKLMENVEVKLNRGNIVLDEESTIICTVASKEITTTNSENEPVQRAKKQIFIIPTLQNQKPILNILKEDLNIADASTDKNKKFCLYRKFVDSKKAFPSSTIELIRFVCDDKEKNEIKNKKDDLLLFESDFLSTLKHINSNPNKREIFEFNFEATVKDNLFFDILDKFKAGIELVKSSDKVVSEVDQTKSKTDDKKEAGSKKMSDLELIIIMILPALFIIFIAISAIIFFKKLNKK